MPTHNNTKYKLKYIFPKKSQFNNIKHVSMLLNILTSILITFNKSLINNFLNDIINDNSIFNFLTIVIIIDCKYLFAFYEICLF